MQRDKQKIRILQVPGSMNRGGAETWLMYILRNIDRSQYKMDFLLNSDQPNHYTDEIRALGCEVIPCLGRPNPWVYAKNFMRIIREHGPYDVIHMHNHHWSGIAVRLAKQAGIPIRIIQSHNDTTSVEASAGFVRRRYLHLMKYWIRKYMTVGLAVSDEAADELFGSNWRLDPRCMRNYPAIDLAPFCKPGDVKPKRKELNIPDNAFVIGHAARFEEQKNHTFLIDIIAEAVKRDPDIYFMLIGDGPLRPSIEQKAREMGITDRALFTGVRSDVIDLLQGTLDAVILPSLYEGLPVILLESQAAGRRCLISDVINRDTDIVKPLMHRMSLTQPADAWAEKIISLKNETDPITSAEAFKVMEQSPSNVMNNIRDLEKLYRSE